MAEYLVLNVNNAFLTLQLYSLPPPIANSDAYTTKKNTTLTVNAPGILSNDVDPAGFLLRPILVSGVMHGMLTLNNDGSFMYIPDNNYVGEDRFTYQCTRRFI